MKKLVLIFVSLLIFSTGCEKQLEENPPARFKIGALNKDVLNSLVIGAYEPLARSRGLLWESYLTLYTEMLGEYCYPQSTNSVMNLATYNFVPARDFLSSSFVTFYQAINRCNLLLDAIENDTAMSTADKQVAKGEALYIRSLCYYWMVRLWGPLPMRLKPISNSNDIGLGLSDVSTIYNQIIADLTVAEGVLPARVPEAQAGRATSGAVKVLLADIYLTRNEYTLARNKSKEVLDNKATYGYELVSSLATLHSPTAATNSEDVFSLKFAQQTGYGMFLAVFAADGRASQAGFAPRGFGFLGASRRAPLIRDWDRRDLRRQFHLYDSLVIGGVRVPANLSQGLDYFFGTYKDPSAPDETGAGNDFYLLRFADALLIFAEAENKLSGPNTAAYNAVNRVRRRAYGVGFDTPSALADLPAGLSSQQFDDLIFRERGYEFMFEARRWFDMQRTGRAAQIATQAGKPAPTAAYLPLPTIEITNNPALQ